MSEKIDWRFPTVFGTKQHEKIIEKHANDWCLTKSQAVRDLIERGAESMKNTKFEDEALKIIKNSSLAKQKHKELSIGILKNTIDMIDSQVYENSFDLSKLDSDYLDHHLKHDQYVNDVFNLVENLTDYDSAMLAFILKTKLSEQKHGFGVYGNFIPGTPKISNLWGMIKMMPRTTKLNAQKLDGLLQDTIKAEPSKEEPLTNGIRPLQ